MHLKLPHRWRTWILALTALGLPVARAADDPPPLSTLAFGSSLDQKKPQSIWRVIEKASPDLFILLGDTIYPDGGRPTDLRNAYAQLRANTLFTAFRDRRPLMAVWDDRDYGKIGGGLEYEFKENSQWEFKNFFRLFEDKQTVEREGVYTSAVYGPPGREVQVILLDTRYFRTPLKKDRKGAIQPETGEGATILGAEQWRWLEEQLKAPAALRIIGSGMQILPKGQRHEKWGNFPLERDRLLGLLRDKQVKGAILISGDRHFAELSSVTDITPYPLFEITSSPLEAAPFKQGSAESNRSRLASYAGGNNFGLIHIDWTRPDPAITLEVRDAVGASRFKRELSLSQLH